MEQPIDISSEESEISCEEICDEFLERNFRLACLEWLDTYGSKMFAVEFALWQKTQDKNQAAADKRALLKRVKKKDNMSDIHSIRK